jgi:eukaryotic-like serine/threonine-protein kinase
MEATVSDSESSGILQRYHLLRKLATGGMAEVYLAEQTGAGGFKKRVAIKRILPSFAADSKFVEMFLDEARLAALFHHPNLIQIYELGEMDGAPCMVMEYVRGASLSDLFRRSAHRPIPLGIAARIVAQAAEGLQYAHEFSDPDTGQPLGLVHRDVSPQNILISTEGIVKVMDFGVAKASGQMHQTAVGTLKGKLSYMPPEQLNGLPADRRGDIWALGVILYELIAGRRPFTGPNQGAVFGAILKAQPMPLEQLRPDVPVEIVKVVTDALAAQPDQRTPDAATMVRQLDNWLQRGPRTASIDVAAWMKPLLPAPGKAAAGMPIITPSDSGQVSIRSLEGQDHVAFSSDALPTAGSMEVSAWVPNAFRGRKRAIRLAVALAVTTCAFGWWLGGRSTAKTTSTSPPEAAAPKPEPGTVTAVVPTPAAPDPPVAEEPKAPAARVDLPPAMREKPHLTATHRHRPKPSAGVSASAAPEEKAEAPEVGPPPALGTLVVNTDPWSRVTIDGRDVGQTPLPNLSLPAGHHEMVCTNPENGFVHRETVVIPPGGTLRRFIHLAGG